MNDKKKAVAVYIRLALDDVNDILPLSVKYLKKIAEEIGNVVGVYIDNRRKKEWLSWDDLMTDCRLGKVDIIVVRSLAHLGRDRTDMLAHLQDLRTLGIQAYFIVEQLFSDSDDFKKTISIYCELAKMEYMNRKDCLI